MEQNQTTTNWTKLDYTLKTAKERADFVANLPKDQLTNKKNLEFLANYIVMAMTPEEKKKKEILTDNRMVTINKRETSLQKLTDSFETGGERLYIFWDGREGQAKAAHLHCWQSREVFRRAGGHGKQVYEQYFCRYSDRTAAGNHQNNCPYGAES